MNINTILRNCGHSLTKQQVKQMTILSTPQTLSSMTKKLLTEIQYQIHLIKSLLA